MQEFHEIPASNKSLGQRKLICGIGINDAKYTTKQIINDKEVRCPYYVIWVDMLKRCYSSKVHSKHPTYIQCYVCKEWLTFSSFKSWMQIQDWQGKQLDKDILFKENKEYSPSTCIFVNQEINKLLTNHAAKRGRYALGVSWSKQAKKYVAQCSVQGTVKNLGFFLTEKEASNIYLTFKAHLIFKIANNQTDMRLKEALIKIALDFQQQGTSEIN